MSVNITMLIGRLTKNPDIRYTQEGKAWGSYTVAVDNPGKDKGASFIGCKAFGDTAVTLEKWGVKGRLVAVVGHIQTGSYINKAGTKVFTTEVITDRIDFLDRAKKDEPDEVDKEAATPIEGFAQITDDDIPF